MIAHLRWRWRIEWTALSAQEQVEVAALWVAEQRERRRDA